MADHSGFSITLRARAKYAKEQVDLLSGWRPGAAGAVASGLLTFLALSKWGTAPDWLDASITTGVATAVFLILPMWRFVRGFWKARVAHLIAMVEELRAQIPETEGWEGVQVGDRYFAWSGPELYG